MNTKLYYTTYTCKLGKIYLVSDGEVLVSSFFENQKNCLDISHCVRNDNLPIFEKTKEWYDNYFSGQKPHPKQLLLQPAKTNFANVVREILLEIPYGETLSYQQVAKRVSQKLNKNTSYARAVANVVARNKFIIIVPCHRVIGKNGALVDFAAGLDKKQWLLKFEGQQFF